MAPTDYHVPPTRRPLGDGSAHALMYPHVLDGNRSTHPLDARGWVTLNSYVFTADDRSVIVDAGYTSDESVMLADVADVVADTPLSIWSTRIAEFNSICNIRALCERFDVDTLYGAQNNPPRWVDFLPGYDLVHSPLQTIDSLVVRTGDAVAVDLAGARTLTALPAPLVLLPTNWIYDEQTRTLLTGDAFGHVWQDSLGEVPIMTSTTSFDEGDFESYYASGRYWWLPGARTDSIRAEIDTIFNDFTIDRIGPAWGAILEGRDVVEFHRQKLDDLLRDAPHRDSVGIETGRLRFGAAA